MAGVTREGFKLLAWQGVTVPVPAAWDLARREGDHRHGAFRIDGHDRARIQVRWQPDRGGSLHEVARRAAALLGQSLPDSLTPATHGELDRAIYPLASADGADSAVLVVQRQSGRLAVLRFDRHQGWPTDELLGPMFKGIQLQSLRDWQQWAIYDMAWSTPPGHELWSAALSAGVVRLEFRQARRWWAIRRFSAANAAMGMISPTDERFESWVAALFSSERHDWRHQITRRATREGVEVVLRGEPRWFSALEFRGVLPRHRRNAALVVARYHRTFNKVILFELDRSDAHENPMLSRVMDSYQVALPWVSDSLRPPSPTSPRTRSLGARVRHRAGVLVRQEGSRVVLQSQVPRGGLLRWLSALNGGGAGPAFKTRTIELDLLGGLLWQRCAEPTPVQVLIDTLTQELQVAPLEATVAVTGFLQAMGSRGLVELLYDGPATQPE